METPAAAHFFEGNRHLAAGDAAGAAVCFRSALALMPDFAAAHANLGLALERGDELDAAEQSYRQALALGAEHAEIPLNLGALLARRRRFAAAEAIYRQGLLRAPRHAATWSNLGVLLASVKREDEAEQCYRTALGLDGAYANARFNLAYLLLRQARFEEGWACLEARDWYVGLAARLNCPRWQGEDLAGKALLIGYEAGHGDIVQFCRYAAVLKARGAARIGLIAYPALLGLLTTLAGVDELIDAAGPLPMAGWDFWTPPLSIPYHCQTRAATIPAAIPYLAAQPDLAAQWAARLPCTGLRVGLVWMGSPSFENDAERSLHDLALLAPLGQVAGASFVSLQKGAGEAAARHPPPGLSLLHLGSDMRDFADAAAIVAGLDLVIAVDTAMAHLAGALGKTCWVMLPYYQTDWRWGADRTDSPWYPGCMRLFRQPAMGDWPPVVAAIGAALADRVAAARSA